MKMVDSKGKLFGMINVVDFLILVSVVLAVGAIAVQLFAQPIADAVSPTVPMTAVFRIRGATDLVQEELARNPLEGKQLVAGNSFLDAVVKQVEIVDYEVQTTTADGRIVTALDPVKKDVIITVETRVTANTPVPKIGTQEVRAGGGFIFKTKDFEMNTLIQSVIIDE